jgi:hypothetical protein
MDQQWGAQVILEAVYRVAGWTGLVMFRSALIALIFGCLLTICLRRGLGARRAALLTLAAFLLSAVALGLRPQLIGMAIFAVVLLLVTDRRAHPGRLWAIPFLIILWANVHGSFFLGPVVLGLAWLGRPRPRAGARRLRSRGCPVAAACHPVRASGPYAIGLSTNPAVTWITEWQPTSMRSSPGIAFVGDGRRALLARNTTPWPRVWLAVSSCRRLRIAWSSPGGRSVAAIAGV